MLTNCNMLINKHSLFLLPSLISVNMLNDKVAIVTQCKIIVYKLRITSTPKDKLELAIMSLLISS
jgi:hypothetical protein